MSAPDAVLQHEVHDLEPVILNKIVRRQPVIYLESEKLLLLLVAIVLRRPV